MLEEFQRTVLMDYFGGATETVIILPKKNGKSTLIAALTLYHLMVTPNAECIVVASSREQAEIILRQARMFVGGSKDLQEHMSVRQRSILSHDDEGRIRVLASDEDTADGAIPTLAIVDELHRAKSIGLYGVLRDGLGPRKGRLITISTAGSQADSPLGKIRAGAYELPTFRRDGTYRTASDPVARFAFHEWALDPDDDVNDMEVVKRANPASWHTVSSLAARKASPSMEDWQWLRFACGIWTEGEEPWIPPEMWDRLVERDLKLSEKLWLGVKVTLEEGAVVAASKVEDVVSVKAHLLPGGESVAERAEELIRELAKGRRVRGIGYDPRTFQRSAELLQSEGFQMVSFPQTEDRMQQASARLYDLIERKALRHEADSEFRAQVMSGTPKRSERGWRIQGQPGVIALTLACALADTQKRGGGYVFMDRRTDAEMDRSDPVGAPR